MGFLGEAGRGLDEESRPPWGSLKCDSGTGKVLDWEGCDWACAVCVLGPLDGFV